MTSNPGDDAQRVKMGFFRIMFETVGGMVMSQGALCGTLHETIDNMLEYGVGYDIRPYHTILDNETNQIKPEYEMRNLKIPNTTHRDDIINAGSLPCDPNPDTGYDIKLFRGMHIICYSSA